MRRGEDVATRHRLIDEKVHRSFSEFSNFLSTAKWNKHGVVYRGQRDVEWKLETTLYRYLKNTIDNFSNCCERERDEELKQAGNRALVSFLRRYSPLRPFPLEKERGSVLFARMQHNGGISPLLDWTQSPYLAAFFALADAARCVNRDNDRHSIAVWALGTNKVKPIENHTDPPVFRSLGNPMTDNRRMVAQQAVMTFNQPVIPLDDWIRQYADGEIVHGAVLTKHVVECQVGHDLALLSKMNINYATAYPDVQGAALHAMLSAGNEEYEGLNHRAELLQVVLDTDFPL